MSSLNKVFLLGRLGDDPVTRAMPNGTAVANFSLATSTFSSKSGEKKEYTEWHKCAAFNKAAEVASQYLRKGSQVLVEGSLRTRKWEDNGVTRYMTEIVVGRLTMLGKPSESNHETHEPQARQPGPDFNDLDDDIPF